MRYYLELGRGGREAAGEWKGREEAAMEGRAAAVRGAVCLDEQMPFRCSGSGTGRGGGYTRLCRATDQGAALPRQDRWRDRALPRQRPALPVAATSALCRAAMHSAAQAFGRARAIGAAKSVS